MEERETYIKTCQKHLSKALQHYSMHWNLLWTLLVLAPLSRCAPSGNEDKNDGTPSPPDLFCAVLNPLTGTYIDLSQLSSTPNEVTDPKTKKKVRKESSKTRWLVKGWGMDRDKNFTVSVCSSPIEQGSGDSKSSKKKSAAQELSNTTGAYYTVSGEEGAVSIGDFSTKPTLFGSSNRKLTLKYENGSLCPGSQTLRKATLLSFVCDREITTKAQISYVGSLQNCSYFFEVRSVHACPTSNKSNEINVVGIFIGIIAVFVLVQYMRRAMQRRIKLSVDGEDSIPASTARGDGGAFSQPDWEFFENRTVLRKISHTLGRAARLGAMPFVLLWQRLQGDVPVLRHRGGATGSGDSSRPIRLYSTPFASGSQSSFFRDMEIQNNILDSLEVQSGSGSSATTNAGGSLPETPADSDNSIV